MPEGQRLTEQQRRYHRYMKSTNGRSKMVAMGLDGEFRTYWVHRYYVELALGRELSADEYVIHLDFDGTNNVLSNLYLASSKEEQGHLCRSIACGHKFVSNIDFVLRLEHNLKHSYAQLPNHYGR